MASGNMKVIKRRIKSVGSTMQITKAMELVASSKLRRAKKKANDSKPFFNAQSLILSEIVQTKHIETVFTRKREVDSAEAKRLFIVIAGDRGLAGGYNSNLFKLVVAAHEGQELPKIIAVGKKAAEFFGKRGYDVVSKYIGLAENVKNAYCADIANTAVNLFKNGDVDEVTMFYTEFVSSMVQKATDMPVLPLEIKAHEPGKHIIPITYDPSPEAVFNRVVPTFIMSMVQCAVTESYASEQCARRIAMESASDNAEEMIDKLSLLYNRARQEKITNEINEIVGGANAL
ncbi:MAG: ATP synthase F1 subunit gamma [Oscillospiraceae bacterium]|nr:ATP synthase F1 subunit gamma [Oscillospiraceae bacterium]